MFCFRSWSPIQQEDIKTECALLFFPLPNLEIHCSWCTFTWFLALSSRTQWFYILVLYLKHPLCFMNWASGDEILVACLRYRSITGSLVHDGKSYFGKQTKAHPFHRPTHDDDVNPNIAVLCLLREVHSLNLYIIVIFLTLCSGTGWSKEVILLFMGISETFFQRFLWTHFEWIRWSTCDYLPIKKLSSAQVGKGVVATPLRWYQNKYQSSLYDVTVMS